MLVEAPPGPQLHDAAKNAVMMPPAVSNEMSASPALTVQLLTLVVVVAVACLWTL